MMSQSAESLTLLVTRKDNIFRKYNFTKACALFNYIPFIISVGYIDFIAQNMGNYVKKHPPIYHSIAFSDNTLNG